MTPRRAWSDKPMSCPISILGHPAWPWAMDRGDRLDKDYTTKARSNTDLRSSTLDVTGGLSCCAPRL